MAKTNKKTYYLLLEIICLVIFLYLSTSIPSIIEKVREHGGGSVSVIFTPGRGSAEIVTNALNVSFSLFAGIAFTLLFFFKGKKNLRKIIYALASFVLLIIGLFYSLILVVISSSTGTGIELKSLYLLIKLFIVGLGFLIMSILNHFLEDE